MPDQDLAKPIPLLITEDIEATLSRVKVENGYALSLVVERLNDTNHAFNVPRHLLAVIDPGDPRRMENAAEGQDEYERTYMIHVWVLPSQTDGRPIDEYFDLVAAAVVRSLCSEVDRAFERGGYAIDTRHEDVEVVGPISNSLAYMVNVPVTVQYTTAVRNPYRKV